MRDKTHRVGEAEVGRAFCRGRPEAVNEVRQRVERIVAFRGYRIPTEEKRDLVQEVMTQLWSAVNRADFDAGGGFWGFVEVVTARRCVDWLRRRRPETAMALEVEVAAGPAGQTVPGADPSARWTEQAVQRTGGPHGQKRGRAQSPDVPLYPQGAADPRPIDGDRGTGR
jgi:DNA-directed RNA polymerase specialized sigma24 family protein